MTLIVQHVSLLSYNLISPNTVSQNDEKPRTAELDDTAYRTWKLKLPKYRMKKAQLRNTVNPHVPLIQQYALQHGSQYKSYYFVEKSNSHKISPLNAFPLKFRL